MGILFDIFVFAIYAFQIHVLVASSCAPKRKEFGPPNYDQVLVGPVLHSFISDGEIPCQLNCHINDNCDKYNFNNQTDECEMLGSPFTYTIEKRIGTGWMFKSIKCENNSCKGFPCYVNNGGPVCLCALALVGKNCEVRALGMEDGSILDSQMTASSDYLTGHEPYRGRLNAYPRMPYDEYIDAAAWTAEVNQVGQYLQVDVGRVVIVTMVATQGRAYRYNQFVKKYKLGYREEGTNVWQEYKEGGIVKEFPGNSDVNTVVQHQLSEDLRTQFVRFIVIQWNDNISMRVEMYGIP